MKAKRACLGSAMLLLSVLLSFLPMSARADVIISASADTLIRTDLDIRSNDNHGQNQYLMVGTGRGGGGIPWGGADAIRSLIRFDLSEFVGPIGHAYLRLTVMGYDLGTPLTVYNVDVHRILPAPPLTPWLEGNGYEGPNSSMIGAPPGAVWVDQAFGVAWAGAGDNPAADAANNTTQPPFELERVARATVRQATDGPGSVIQWDITDLVNAWISGEPNEGILLRDPTTDNDFHALLFWSREGLLYHFPQALDGPTIVITQEPSIVPEPSSLALLVAGVAVLSWSWTRQGDRRSA